MRGRKRPLVLLVDDEPENRELYGEALSDARLAVIVAEDGPAGLVKAHALLPDVIVMDYSMPGSNGLEIVERLKADPRTRDIPVILFTGDDVADALTARCAAVVTKPCSLRQLVEAVQAQL